MTRTCWRPWRLREGGDYTFVEGEDNIGESFGEALGGLLSLSHQNVCATLMLSPGVSLLEAKTKFAQTDSTDGTSFDLGDLYAEENRDILFHLRLPPVAEDQDFPIAKFLVKGFSVSNKAFEEEVQELSVARSADPQLVLQQQVNCNIVVERHMLRHLATTALERAAECARVGSLTQAQEVLQHAIDLFASSKLTKDGDEMLVHLLTDLQDLRKDFHQEASYASKGSKKAYVMQQMYCKQRSCGAASEFTSNVMQKEMRAMFKTGIN